jgi:lysophospholipase L1-like esterase
MAAAGVLTVQCAHRGWPVVHNAATQHEIEVFGDSLALGEGATSPDTGFVGLLYKRVVAVDPTARITVRAVGGPTADVQNDQIPQAGTDSPTDVWLCVGGNDVTHGTPTEQFSATERAIVDAARKSWPQAHIVVFGIPDVARAPLLPGLLKIRYHNDASLDNDAAREAARSDSADFVDLFSFSDSDLDLSQDFAPDAFHPNDRGYAAIAAFAAKSVL